LVNPAGYLASKPVSNLVTIVRSDDLVSELPVCGDDLVSELPVMT
jgi:hypothetical protein